MTILFHPGYHKTGTTWLQNSLFSDHRLFDNLLSHEEIDALIVRPHELVFDVAPVRARVQERRGRTAGAIDVVSSEIMLGNPFFGYRGTVETAHRLKAIAPDACILITVRNQPAILRSFYQQYLGRGGFCTAEEFFTPEFVPGYLGFDPALVEFDRVADCYAQVFGKDRVLVLPQELLAHSRYDFVDALLLFCGARALPPNFTFKSRGSAAQSPPLGSVPLLRLANRLRKTALNPGASRVTAPLGNMLARMAWRQRLFSGRYRKEIERALRPYLGCYGASNRRLQRYVPVDLAALGYEVEAAPPVVQERAA